MIALPRSATKALKLWSWKDTHGMVDTREDGLADKGMPKSHLDVHGSSPEELKADESCPIEHEPVAPVVRSHSKLVKKRDPSGNESKKEAVPPVPVTDPAATTDLPSRPATPSTIHAPPSVDSETAEHVIVPSNPPRSPTPKHNVLVKNSLSKRAAAKPAASSVSDTPPDLPNRDTDEPATATGPLDDATPTGAVLDNREAAGEDDTAAVQAPELLGSTLGAESGSEIEAEPETPAQSLPFPVRGSTPPNGTRFFEGTDGELEPTESRTTGTMSGRVRPARPARPQRRISLRSFGFFYGKDSRPHAFPAYVPPTERVVYEGVEPEAEVRARSSSQPILPRVHKRSNSLIPIGLLTPRKPAIPKVAKTDKRAIESALSLRTLIIGPAAMDPNTKDKGKRPSDPKASAAQALRKVNQQLLVPAEANRVIAALRELPPPDLPPATAERVETVRRKKGWMFGRGTRGEEKHKEAAKENDGTVAIPIHGCCLDMTDEEAEEKHFSKLTGSRFAQGSQSALTGAGANIGSADLSSLIPVLKDMRLVNLQASPDMSSMNAASLSADLTAPDLGFGQSADKNGPLAGSVPSTGSLVDGMEKVGQTLMSLGFATTAAMLPSHVGIHPPKDRMSVLTYWWGYEVVFPPPTMRYLGKVKSISGALMNFLTAFSLFSNGVREMLPFIRYIAQFIDFEWNAIKAQDKGRGVVCAATWVMPAALVPRPWDFVDPPVMSSKHVMGTTPGSAARETFTPVMALAADASVLEVAEANEAGSGSASTEVRDGEAVAEREIEKVESPIEREEGLGSGTGSATTDFMTAASRHDDAEPGKVAN